MRFRLAAQALPVFLLLLGGNVAHAWMRSHYEDATIVERSELIVIAHLKEGSIQYVPHERKPTDGRSWEHHATLVITSVLKGKSAEKEIPVILHYGLTPLVGGHVQRDGFMINLRGNKKDYPADIIELFDSGSRHGVIPAPGQDLRKDQLWFLRKRSGTYGREPGNGNFGIVDPEDLQLILWKDYFLSYLAADPEAAMRKYIQQHPEAETRAAGYLDHLAVERILKIPDDSERYDKLLPYFLKRTTWGMKHDARAGIIGCGKVGGERLRKVFDDPSHKPLRQLIIGMWREMGYRDVAPLLIELLKQHDKFWAKQDLPKGWWNSNSEEARHRQDVYGEVYCGVCALRSFKDPAARYILKLTRHRWKEINFEDRQIVEECEAALRELPGK